MRIGGIHPHGHLSLNIPICKLSGALETEDHEDWWHTIAEVTCSKHTICKLSGALETEDHEDWWHNPHGPL